MSSAPKQTNIAAERAINYQTKFPAKLRLLRWLGRQNWIRRGRDRVLRLFCNPNTCAPYPFEVGFYGHRYQGDLTQHIDWHVFMYGDYAYPELSFLKTVALEMRKKGLSVNFLDVGGNLGQHTLFMSSFADQVISVEPFAELGSIIRKKISLNNLNNVTLLPVALGRSNGELNYYPAVGRNSGMGTLMEASGDQFGKPVSVAVRNGDELLEEQKFHHINLIKIDTEGFEPLVLQGLAVQIKRNRPVILTEFSQESRKHLPSEGDFRALFYPDAVLVEVASAGGGRRFTTRPFNYSTSREVAIAPPEWAHLLTP